MVNEPTGYFTATLTTSKFIRYFSIGIFIFSLLCPCFDTEKAAGGPGQGGGLLLQGLFWFMYMSPGFVWLANPLLLFSWIYLNKKRTRSLIFSVVSFFMAACFLFYKDMLTDESGSNSTPIIAHQAGYWLWLVSILIMLFGNLYLKVVGDDLEKSPAPANPAA